MRTIDAFNHFFPKRYYDALLETLAGAKDLGKRVRGIPGRCLMFIYGSPSSSCSIITRKCFRTACRR